MLLCEQIEQIRDSDYFLYKTDAKRDISSRKYIPGQGMGTRGNNVDLIIAKNYHMKTKEINSYAKNINLRIVEFVFSDFNICPCENTLIECKNRNKEQRHNA